MAPVTNPARIKQIYPKCTTKKRWEIPIYSTSDLIKQTQHWRIVRVLEFIDDIFKSQMTMDEKGSVFKYGVLWNTENNIN